ncbi:IS110 family transposase [Phormidium tenue FACHB-886]|nr:IS110 family transposase [Phormidium tenue FACHB-886]
MEEGRVNQQPRILGIDISKAKFHVALLLDNGKAKKKVFANNIAGFALLSEWLSTQGVRQVHSCLEATNTYGQAVARYLYEQGHRVSVVNPLQVQGFAQSQLSRNKTDSADAATIAQFCATLQPRTWKPAEPASEQLQQMTRRLEGLQQMINQEKNRLDTAIEMLQEEIEEHIVFMEHQMKKIKEKIQLHIKKNASLQANLQLLMSITGIAQTSGAQILAELGNFQDFHCARALAAYAGLTPQAHESGSSVQGKTRLCKIGNAHLRRALYFPALTALRRCEPIRDWAEQLRARGKTRMQVVGAVMHKLLRIVYGVLKSRQPFNLELLVTP